MSTATQRATRTRWRRLVEQMNTLGLSIVLGFIIWLIAINQENPIVIAPYDERVPVTVRGLSEDLQPIQDLSNETVQVTLQAPQSSWSNLSPSDFNAYLDLSDLGPGVHEVEVNVDVVDPKVRIAEVQRPELRVQLDQVITKSVPVRVDIMDSTAFGYDWQTPVVEPKNVSVVGPETQVNQVNTARTEIFLRNAKSQVERTQSISPYNSQGQSVPRVTPQPNQVHVVVPVEQWPGRKEVAVRVNLVGQPPPGYRLSSVRVNPSTVVLTGATDVLADVPGFVETEAVTITSATSEVTRRVQLHVPEDVTVLEGTVVDVTASVTAIEGGTTVRQEPVIQGLSNGLTATVALETVDVILSGPLPLLESLGPDDVFVILDLNGLLPGNHVITPRVVVPDGIQAQGVLPETVEVVIASSSTAAGPPITATTTVTASPGPSVPPVQGTPGTTSTVTTTPGVETSGVETQGTGTPSSPLETPSPVATPITGREPIDPQ